MKETLEQEAELPTPWHEFVDRNRVALAAIEKSVARERESSEEEEFNPFDQVVGTFMESLAEENLPLDQPLTKDILTLRRAIAAIAEVKRENVLTGEEAMAVVEFLMAKFVQRRVGRIFRKMVPHGSSSSWFYRSRRVVK